MSIETAPALFHAITAPPERSAINVIQLGGGAQAVFLAALENAFDRFDTETARRIIKHMQTGNATDA